MKVRDRLSRRERALVLGVLPMLLLVVGYRFGWVPLDQARTSAEAQIASYRTLIEAVETAGTRLPEPRAADVPKDPLATRITRSANATGILVQRLEPEGDLIRVSLDETPFDDIMRWIAEMEAQESISLKALEMDRRTSPGVVMARLTLENTR